MTVKEVIEKAVEGGWLWRGKKPYSVSDNGCWVHTTNRIHDFIVCLVIFSDSLFWQSLGKAMGWENDLKLQWANKGVAIGDTHWLFQWHRFTDHLAQDKTPEGFFKDLT